MDLDLHIHSTASDGSLPPFQVVDRALAAGLHVIALTDHDTTAGVAEARRSVKGRPLDVIPALEVSTTYLGKELHILGYFVDPDAPELMNHQRWAGRRRRERIQEMLELLRRQDVNLPFSAVVQAAGGDPSNLGRPHLAGALVEAGYVADVNEAFQHLIGNDHPAYIPTDLGPPAQGIEMIRDAGGVAVWAHPPPYDVEDLLPRLVRDGLQGLEVYRPRNSLEYTVRLEGLARRFGLVVSGGSDWHGPEGGELGEFRLRGEEVAGLLELGGL